MTQTTKVIVQKWEESERGWGCRPDGYSIHLNEADMKKYIAGYWRQMPEATPDEYSRPNGTPYEANIKLSKGDKLKLQAQHGLRFWDNKYPGTGGKDGWVNAAE